MPGGASPPLGCARHHLRDHEAREVESRREGGDVEVAHRHEPALVDHHERVRLVRVELLLDLLDGKPSASRAAPWSCGMVRKLSGSWSERA